MHACHSSYKVADSDWVSRALDRETDLVEIVDGRFLLRQGRQGRRLVEHDARTAVSLGNVVHRAFGLELGMLAVLSLALGWTRRLAGMRISQDSKSLGADDLKRAQLACKNNLSHVYVSQSTYCREWNVGQVTIGQV